MPVAVMQVGIVGVRMPQRLVPVPMGVRLRHGAFVGVLVVLVVHMAVLMFKNVVLMLVAVAFGEMQPEAQTHEEPGERQLQGHGLMQEPDRDERADKGRQ